MTWLKKLCSRRESKDEIDWLKLMGIENYDDRYFLEEKDRIQKEEHQCIKHLGMRIDPKWYQELSDRQIQLLPFFYDAVRNDFDLKTVQQTATLLRLLGLEPMPHRDLIRRALILSGGHELAFLWFLADICYLTFHNYTKSSGICT